MCTAFICRQITRTDSVLEADDTIVCEQPSHRGLQVVSGFVVAVVAVGLPLVFGGILVYAAHEYNSAKKLGNMEIARLLAVEMNADLSVSQYVVRDVMIGGAYSFLMDAFKPQVSASVRTIPPLHILTCQPLSDSIVGINQFLYWEAMDMFRA